MKVKRWFHQRVVGSMVVIHKELFCHVGKLKKIHRDELHADPTASKCTYRYLTACYIR